MKNNDKVILLIDDQHINFNILDNLLKIYKYNLLHAENLQEAYKILNLIEVNLFIVDHFLSKEEYGLDFLKSKEYEKAKKYGAKAIYHSIEYKEELKKELEELGVQFIQKIFNNKKLVYEINKILS